MTSAALSAPDLQLIDKLNRLDLLMNEEIVERRAEIRTSVVALMSRRHHFQLGVPGIAKSLLVRKLFSLIGELGDEHLFQRLLTQFSTPDEVFGIPSIKGMEEDVFRRNTSFMLPNAYIAFLDEIFFANSSILNSLLTIMNERLFFNGEAPISTDVCTIFSASNTLPTGQELNALWDRLHFRHHVQPIQDRENFIKVLKHGVNLEPNPVITWSEILRAQELTSQVVITDEVYEAIVDLRDLLLRDYSIEVTDRRFIETIPVIQATCLLDRRTTAVAEDMRLLVHMLWSHDSQITDVRKGVFALVSPIEKDASDLYDAVRVLREELEEKLNDPDLKNNVVAGTIMEIHKKTQDAFEKYQALQERADKMNRSYQTLNDLQELLDLTGKLISKAINGPTI